MKRELSLFLLLIIFPPSLLQTQSQQRDTISIQLGSNPWTKTTINTLIVKNENASWWHDGFISSTLNAINQWNEALAFFSSKYPDFMYLSRLYLEPTVSDQMEPGYDLYVIFSEKFQIDGHDALGVTKTNYARNRIKDSYITLAAKLDFVTLNRNDIQNSATHELGHALGLAHSNSSRDLMYPVYDVFSTDNAISTLDIYGVAVFFNWTVKSEFKSTGKIRDSVTLPANINFEYAPITNPAPKAITDTMVKVSEMTGQVLLNPIIFLLAATTIMLFVIMGLCLRKGFLSSKKKN